MRLDHCCATVIHLFAVLAAAISFSTVVYSAERSIERRATGPDNPLMLWYPKPADKWTDGVTVGNGRLGAMIFGRPEKDRLQLNEITVWSGGRVPLKIQ